jgi:hypothetical protein
VLGKLNEVGLVLNSGKCEFNKSKIRILGHLISQNGISIDPERVQALKSLKLPSTRKELESFLGMINYCCRFLQGVSLETKYLYGLIKKNANTDFGTLCRDEKYISAIESLKNLVSNAQTLSLPRDDGIFILTTDASDLGVGAILSQVQEKEEKIISYFSKVHNKAEENYGITEKELLAVIKAVQQFRSYLLGRKFILRTDHSAIKYLFTTRNMKGRLARWSLLLQEFDMQIDYKNKKYLLASREKPPAHQKFLI